MPTALNLPCYFTLFFRPNDFDYPFEDSAASPADYTPNPATPGYQPDTPQGPYTPQTPGSAYSPYGQPAPSPGGYQAPSPGGSFGTPSPAGFQPTPSPQGYSPGTPSPIGYHPMTPGAPFTPGGGKCNHNSYNSECCGGIAAAPLFMGANLITL